MCSYSLSPCKSDHREKDLNRPVSKSLRACSGWSRTLVLDFIKDQGFWGCTNCHELNYVSTYEAKFAMKLLLLFKLSKNNYTVLQMIDLFWY
ncbi:hypothetical protein Plhal304r1_c019g0068761 [Plasmopara halstedii]